MRILGKRSGTIKIPSAAVYAQITFNDTNMLDSKKTMISIRHKCAFYKQNEGTTIQIENRSNRSESKGKGKDLFDTGIDISLSELNKDESKVFRFHIIIDGVDRTGGVATGMEVPFAVKYDGWKIQVNLKCYIKIPLRAYVALAQTASQYAFQEDIVFQGQQVGTLEWWWEEAKIDPTGKGGICVKGLPAQIHAHLKDKMTNYLHTIIDNTPATDKERNMNSVLVDLFQKVQNIKETPKNTLGPSDDYSEETIKSLVTEELSIREEDDVWRHNLCKSLIDLWLNKAIKTELGTIEVTKLEE